MLSLSAIISQNLHDSKRVLNEFLEDAHSLVAIEHAADLMINALKSGHKIIACGNGGSMSDAMHFAEELTGRFRQNRISLPAIAISDPAFITCTANDYGYEKIFSRFIEGVGQKNDVLLAISTSGNSTNVINAVEAAKLKGIKCIALTGKKGGKLAELCEVAIIAPDTQWADRIQEIHIKVIHCLIDCIEVQLNLQA